jgi:hypothetical protein
LPEETSNAMASAAAVSVLLLAPAARLTACRSPVSPPIPAGRT